jgi:Domain of unknown function (DUF4158)
VADPSQVKRYTERMKTRFDHQWEIRRVYGLKEFAEVETEFVDWAAARSWTSGDGPKAIFLDGMAWLRERKILLPEVTTLARLVARTPPRSVVIRMAAGWRRGVMGADRPRRCDGRCSGPGRR